MARKKTQKAFSSHTLPSSPSHSFSSSSSSDFEFRISRSPCKSSSALCPADDLFYKGQLLPLHLSPRLSMVRTLLLASSSTSSSSDTTTTASRDSSGSSNDSHYSSSASDLGLLADHLCESSRPSSAADDEEFRRLHHHHNNNPCFQNQIKKNKYFSLLRFSSVFKKEASVVKNREADNVSGSSVKRMSATAKEVFRKYLKKVKPLYEKISQKQNQQQQKMGGGGFAAMAAVSSNVSLPLKTELSGRKNARKETGNGGFSHSFSGNLRYPRKRSCVSSCPSSMRSSPSHSGVLCRAGFMNGGGRVAGGMQYADTSSMEELQSAIQGAIAHCKNSMIQGKTMLSNEI